MFPQFIVGPLWPIFPLLLPILVTITVIKLQPSSSGKNAIDNTIVWIDQSNDTCSKYFRLQSRAKIIWEEADKACKAYKGRLARFHNANDIALVDQLLKKDYAKVPNMNWGCVGFWISGSASVGNTTFRYEDGSEFDFANFDKSLGEPNFKTIGAGCENLVGPFDKVCVRWHPQNNTWDDVSCSARLDGVLCERLACDNSTTSVAPAVTITTSPATTSSRVNRLNGKNLRYFTVQGWMNWQEAKGNCSARGGKLVEISNILDLIELTSSPDVKQSPQDIWYHDNDWNTCTKVSGFWTGAIRSSAEKSTDFKWTDSGSLIDITFLTWLYRDTRNFVSFPSNVGCASNRFYGNICLRLVMGTLFDQEPCNTLVEGALCQA